jgi:hypothetical protein
MEQIPSREATSCAVTQAFYGTRKFITAFTRVLHWSLSWATPSCLSKMHPTILTSQVPNLMSMFLSLGRLVEESVQVRGSFRHFVARLFLTGGVISPTSNSQDGGQLLVGCSSLLIQYIRSSFPQLEAVPPSATRGRAMLWWQGTNLT